MTLAMHPGRPGVELTADPRFAGRVKRLVAVSLGALGVITALAARTDAATPVVATLAAGWVLMPTLLAASLRRPRLRYLLAIPATLVGGALTTLCLTALPSAPQERVGWLLVTGGIWLGGSLGMWLWFRWIPVPRSLEDPFGPSRWILAGLHIAAIAVGVALIAL